MKWYLQPVALIGISFSASAHAQPADKIATCGERVVLTGALHAAACHSKHTAKARTVPQASAHKLAVHAGVRTVPTECSSGPLVATCYPT